MAELNEEQIREIVREEITKYMQEVRLAYEKAPRPEIQARGLSPIAERPEDCEI